MIFILPHDASAARGWENSKAKTNKKSGALLLASSALVVAAALPGHAASEKALLANKPADKPSASKASAKVPVPAAALSALSQARRLMAALGEERSASRPAVGEIENQLRTATAIAPQWLEARRALARWHSAQRQWSNAVASWQEVLELSPTDREAKNEVSRALRWADSFTAPALALQRQSLVSFGHDPFGSFDSPFRGGAAAGLNTRTQMAVVAQAQPALKQAQPALKTKAPQPSGKVKTAVRPLTVLEIRSALGVVPAKPVPAKQSTNVPADIPVVPGVTTIVVEDAAPPELQEVVALAGVSGEARAALARARQLAATSALLPDAENWAAQEFARAVQLAPQWVQAHREKALWHEAREEWSNAAASWEMVTELAPADGAARRALQHTRRLADTYNEWASRLMVTIGHDSSNPVAQPDPITLRVLAAPLPAPVGGAPEPAPTLTPVAPDPNVAAAAATAAVDAAPDKPVDVGNAKPVPNTPATATPPVNVQTVLPGASSLPPTRGSAPTAKPTAKPVVKATAKPTPKPVAKPAAKPVAKPVAKPAAKPKASLTKTVAKPVAKPAAKPAVAKTAVALPPKVSKGRELAAWPLVNRAGRAMSAKNFATALKLYQQANTLNPRNTYAALGVADALMILKRYPEAIAAYDRFLAWNPGHAKALRGLADSYAFSNQYDEAARINSVILAKNPKDFGAALQAAQVMSWAKNYVQAGRFYRMALAAQPQNAAVWTEYAEMLSYAKEPQAREAFGRALQLDPQSQRAMTGLANLLSWSGEYANAIPLYRGILARDPENQTARISLADALTFSSQAVAAIPLYQEALKSSPNSAQARLGLGRALTIARRYDDAIDVLVPFVKEQPANTEALDMLGIAQITSQPGAALGTFQNLLKLQDQPLARAATLANIGELQLKLGQGDAARASFSEALTLAPADNKIALAYVRALLRQELYKDAEPVLAGVLQREPANVSALLLQATLAVRGGEKERAAALTEQLQAVPLDVSDDALNLFYALRGANQNEAANRLLARLAESKNATLDAQLKVANAVRDTGQEEASYDLYKRIIEANPDFVQAHLELAEAYVRRKEFDAAQKEVDAVLARAPGNVPARILNATLTLRRDRSAASLDNAVILYKSALDADPKNVQAQLGLGEVYSTRSQFAQAAESYRAALEVNPENLQARLGLARNLYYLKQVDESIKEYQALIQRVPDDSRIKLELAQLYLDRNRLDDAQKLFIEVLKAAEYPLPAATAALAARVPGSGEILSDDTRRTFRDFAAQENTRLRGKEASGG